MQPMEDSFSKGTRYWRQKARKAFEVAETAMAVIDGQAKVIAKLMAEKEAQAQKIAGLELRINDYEKEDNVNRGKTNPELVERLKQILKDNPQ
jgi:hypothetical protein